MVSLTRRAALATGAAVISTLSGCSAVSGVFSSPVERRWRLTTNGGIWHRPALTDGTLYVADDSGTLTAVDAATGEVPWREYGFGENVSPPAVANGRVYVGTRDAYAFTSEGDRLWRTPLDDTLLTQGPAPLMGTDTVSFVTADGTTVALAVDTGEERWRQGTDVRPASAALSDGVLYLAGFDGAIQTLTASDGTPGWGNWTSERTGLEAVDGIIYLGAGRSVTALDARTGYRQWEYAPGKAHYRRPVVVDGTAYVAGYELEEPGVVDALDAETGERRWRVELGDGAQPRPPAVDGDTVYVADHSGVVTVIGTDGEVRWRHRVEHGVLAAPRASDGWLYVGTQESIVALDVP